MAYEQEECVWCERVWAVLGLTLGLAVAYIAVDTLTQGRLTQITLRQGRQLASVTPLHDTGQDESA